MCFKSIALFLRNLSYPLDILSRALYSIIIFHHYIPSLYSSIIVGHYIPALYFSILFQHYIPVLYSRIIVQHYSPASQSSIIVQHDIPALYFSIIFHHYSPLQPNTYCRHTLAISTIISTCIMISCELGIISNCMISHV